MVSRTSLRLRPLVAFDRDLYIAWISDPVSLEWSPVPNPDAEFHRAVGSRHNFVVEADDGPVGAVAVEGDWHAAEPVVEFGIIIDPGRRGRGLGHEATRLTLRTAFEELGAHRVVHGVYRENYRVVDFFRDVGFREDPQSSSGPDGRPAVRFSITRDDWQSRP